MPRRLVAFTLFENHQIKSNILAHPPFIME